MPARPLYHVAWDALATGLQAEIFYTTGPGLTCIDARNYYPTRPCS